MKVTFACPACRETVTRSVTAGQTGLACSVCGHSWATAPVPSDELAIDRCLVCPSTELFVRKDFPQRLGLAIVVLGFAVSCVTWYYYQVKTTFFILFATALLDVVLYLLVGDVLTCYRCRAEYRGGTGLNHHGPFHLETHERFRQQAARLREQERHV